MTSPNPSNTKGESPLGKNLFIWGNIALMAGIPWLLTLSMAGLAVGDPVFPEWFEISLLGLPAIALVTWLQWIQPISPFSLWFIARPVESLSEQERRALTLISQQRNGWYVTGWIAIAVAILMSAVFCKIYADSPLAQVIAPFPDELRFFGVLWAEVFFLLSNVLLQSGVSALRVKLTADSELSSLIPFAPEKVKNSFTHIGWRSPTFFTEDQLDPTLEPISPETLTEEITNVVEEQESEISDLGENEAIDESQEEMEVSDVVAEELEINNEELAVVEEILEEIEDIAIAEISSEGTEVIDITSLDFENQLDELIAFNFYVENILQEYLEEESLDDATNNHPDDTNNDGVVDITELTATSETATAIAEEVLIAEEILEEGIPESITPPPTLEIPEVEEPTDNPDDTNNDGVVDITELTATSETATAIAEEVLIAEEILEEGIPEVVADLSTLEIPQQKTGDNLALVESQEEPQTPKDPAKSRKYLVEEFLVDKYLAKLEQINNAEKNAEINLTNPTVPTVTQPIEAKPVIDEFAGLDEIIDGKTIDG